MKILIISFFFLNFIISNDKNGIPKLDLRDAGELNLKLELGDLFKNIEGNPQNYLIQEQIEVIKTNAKNYDARPVNLTDLVVLETNLGIIKLKLFPEIAPNHCLNFKKLSNSGYYDKTLFHRVIPGFMIQGGDILTRDAIPENDGIGNPGWTVDAEFNDISHKRGILSMARSKDPNSAGSQFFICLAEAPHLDKKYTVFGEVVGDDNLLDIISNIPSEHKHIISLSRNSIPVGANIDDWLSYKTKQKLLFFKIPESQTKDSYFNYIDQKIKNKDRPSIPVIIKKIRVVDEKFLNKDNN